MPKHSDDRSDRELVEACLAGEAQAWEALLEKYKKLIYSVPLRYQLSPDDAADIFQSVCLDLYRELPGLRSADAVRGWLVRVAAHKSLRWKVRGSRFEQYDSEQGEEGSPAMPDWAADLERDQLVRESIAALPSRCRELVRMLFFEDPPRPYNEVAAELGLATGSIGFIRARCLGKLAKALKAAGL
jgi:RNA polymerase sigma factor (sigma-70 family)